MTLPAINLVAVLTCSIITYLLGAIWYSPRVFRKHWAERTGTTLEEFKQKSFPMMYVMTVVLVFMTCIALAFVVHLANAQTLLDGALVGAICWIGFAGSPSYAARVIFAGKPTSLWFIDTGYNLASMMLTGAILAVWQ